MDDSPKCPKCGQGTANLGHDGEVSVYYCFICECLADSKPSASDSIKALVASGFTRSEAMALLLTERGATSVVVNSIDDGRSQEVEQENATLRTVVQQMQQVVEALQGALGPYLSPDDIERLTTQAMQEAG